MYVTLDQIHRGVTGFADCELGQKATGLGKFAIYFLLPSLPKMATDYVAKLRDIAPEMFDEDSRIDIDAAKERAYHAMTKCGSVEISGIKFLPGDIETLYRHICGS